METKRNSFVSGGRQGADKNLNDHQAQTKKPLTDTGNEGTPPPANAGVVGAGAVNGKPMPAGGPTADPRAKPGQALPEGERLTDYHSSDDEMAEERERDPDAHDPVIDGDGDGDIAGGMDQVTLAETQGRSSNRDRAGSRARTVAGGARSDRDRVARSDRDRVGSPPVAGGSDRDRAGSPPVAGGRTPEVTLTDRDDNDARIQLCVEASIVAQNLREHWKLPISGTIDESVVGGRLTREQQHRYRACFPLAQADPTLGDACEGGSKGDSVIYPALQRYKARCERDETFRQSLQDWEARMRATNDGKRDCRLLTRLLTLSPERRETLLRKLDHAQSLESRAKRRVQQALTLCRTAQAVLSRKTRKVPVPIEVVDKATGRLLKLD